MNSQPSLITVAEDSNVLKPTNSEQWQMFRDNTTPGNGSYYAMNKDGIKEPLATGSGGSCECLMFVKKTLSTSEFENLATTPVDLILPLAPPVSKSPVIIQAGVSYSFQTAYSIAPDNFLSLNLFDSAIRDAICRTNILSLATSGSSYLFDFGGIDAKINNANFPFGSFKVVVGMWNSTGGSISNPAAGVDGTISVWAWYVQSIR